MMTLLMGANLNPVFSQSIEESTWFACNIYDDSTFIKFENDSIYFKSPPIQGFEEFVAVSLYSIAGDTLNWSDLEGSNQCDPNIIGQYFFHVNDDTLTFSLIDDQCDFRLEVLTELILKREISTGNKTVFDENFTIYPNPVFGDNLTIKAPENLKFHYSIFSNTGIQIMHGNKEGQSILNLERLHSGYYFLRITDLNGKFFRTFKIIKI